VALGESVVASPLMALAVGKCGPATTPRMASKPMEASPIGASSTIAPTTHVASVHRVRSPVSKAPNHRMIRPHLGSRSDWDSGDPVFRCEPRTPPVTLTIAQWAARCPFGLVPHVQARLLARHLRGELDVYIPYTSRWDLSGAAAVMEILVTYDVSTESP
jgi:hypothetical protein